MQEFVLYFHNSVTRSSTLGIPEEMSQSKKKAKSPFTMRFEVHMLKMLTTADMTGESEAHFSFRRM